MRASARTHTEAHALHRHLKSLLIFIGKVIAVKVAVGKQEQTNTAARGRGEEGETAACLKSSSFDIQRPTAATRGETDVNGSGRCGGREERVAEGEMRRLRSNG